LVATSAFCGIVPSGGYSLATKTLVVHVLDPNKKLFSHYHCYFHELQLSTIYQFSYFL